MIQVVADCILDSGPKREPVSPDEVLQTLYYFNIPETLWPKGLIAASAVSRKYDIEACTIMDTVKGKVMAMAKDTFDFDRTQEYYVYKNSEQGPFKVGNAFGLKTEFDGNLCAELVCKLPQALQDRIQALGDKPFLQVQFNPKTKLRSDYPWRDRTSSWSFTIKVHSLSTQKGINSHLKVTS